MVAVSIPFVVPVLVCTECLSSSTIKSNNGDVIDILFMVYFSNDLLVYVTSTSTRSLISSMLFTPYASIVHSDRTVYAHE